MEVHNILQKLKIVPFLVNYDKIYIPRNKLKNENKE